MASIYSICKELTKLRKTEINKKPLYEDYYYWNFQRKFELLMNSEIRSHNLLDSESLVLPGFGKAHFYIMKLLKAENYHY